MPHRPTRGVDLGLDLSQATFAKLFARAMDVLGIQGTWLGEQTGIHPTTISRYRDPEYVSGPPHPRKRRQLEEAMGLPEGYLDGKAEADLPALKRQRAGAGRMPGAGPAEAGRTPATERSEAEEQVRVLLREAERTVAAQIGDPETIGKDFLRRLRTTMVEEFIEQARESGRPIPPFLYEIRYELDKDLFR